MLYARYSSLAGHLREANNMTPFYPLAPRPAQAITSGFIYDSIKTKPAPVIAPVRASSGHAVKPEVNFSPNLPAKLLFNYKRFQQNMETPVFIAGGKRDVILFAIVGATVFGNTAWLLKIVYDLAQT